MCLRRAFGYFISPLFSIISTFSTSISTAFSWRQLCWPPSAFFGWRCRRQSAVGGAAAHTHVRPLRPVRKTAPLDALPGLALETLLLLPFALAYLGWLAQQGRLLFVGLPPAAACHADRFRVLLTTVPLLLFAAGAPAPFDERFGHCWICVAHYSIFAGAVFIWRGF